MPLDDHRNPDGSYNGVAVMAQLTGLPNSEVLAMWDQVKANHAKLAGCPWHEFERLVTAPSGRERYGCKHCRGTIDGHAYHWHEQGRRRMLAADSPAAVELLCVDGPFEGQVRTLFPAEQLHASRWVGDVLQTAVYRREVVDGREVLVFCGWPT